MAKLPVRYLGIPLNSKAINAQDCSGLIDRITSRIHSWSNRYLSRAGRRLLIQSVLHSVISVERECNRQRFLVSWKEVCKEKIEGGLGIKDLSVMNEALRLNQLWELSKDADSVWKAWTRAYWTKGKD
ncbi:hypothetical protein QQ045_026557 [Rhodiola kirilowii]